MRSMPSRRRDAGPASAWLFGIASKKLIDAQRRGYAERRARRRLGMERIERAAREVAQHPLGVAAIEDLERRAVVGGQQILVAAQLWAHAST